MNTRHLEEFLVFAEELNWSTAAERLFTTRPTLVDHVRALEAELECKLAVSSQRQMGLTPAGRRFVQEAQGLLHAWSETCAEYRALADNLLTVTVSSSNLPWLETLLYKARRAIHERHPYKRIDVAVVSGTLASTAALDEHANDIVVAGYKSYLCEDERPPLPADLCSFSLGTEEIKLVMTQDNPLFGRPEVRAADLDGATFVLPGDIYESWVRDRVAERFAQNGARIALRTGDFSDHVEYYTFEFGKALGIVPTTLLPRYGIDMREEYRAFSLADLVLETSFFAVCKRVFAESENGGLLFDEMRRLAEV